MRSVTEAHDGRLTIEPRPEGGLLVEVSLPAARLNGAFEGSFRFDTQPFAANGAEQPLTG